MLAQILQLPYEIHVLVWHKILGLAQYVNQFLVWHKKLGPAPNFLGPVKGQDINLQA